MATRSKKQQRRQRRKSERIRNVPRDFVFVDASAGGSFTLQPIDLAAAAAEGAEGTEQKPKLRKFSMRAYNGGPMMLGNFYAPVVVDLAGLKTTGGARPILRDHNPAQIVGHSDAIENNGRGLAVNGTLSAVNPHAAEVAASADNGFPWQVSIGASAERMVFLDRGEKTVVNGQTITGPAYIARASRLREVSFVALGADDSTRAKMVAHANNSTEGNDTMDFQQWLEANGWDSATLNATQLAQLQAAYDAEQADGDDDETPANVNAGGTATATQLNATAVEQLRAELLAETTRVNAIHAACTGDLGSFPAIEAQAIKEGWTIEKTELAVLRAARPQAPAQHSKTLDVSAKTLEAALMLNCTGLAESQVGRMFDDKTMNAAIGRQYNGVGLHYLMHQVIRANGKHHPAGLVNQDFVRAAFAADELAVRASGGFSSISLSGILGNVANKTMLSAYRSVNVTWPKLAKIAAANDFKTHTKYRLTGVGQFEEVGKGGELKHISLSEDSYSNRVKTRGAMLALTYEDLVNDDMQAFLDLAHILGRMANISVEKAFYILLLANAGSFFSTANGNYQEGAATALDINSLSDLEQLFLDQTDSNGDPLLLLPKYLLVPTSLKVTAENLFKEKAIVLQDTGNVEKPAVNNHVGKFEPVVSPYLNAQSLSGSSAVGHYLWGDPQDVAAVEVAFLKGKQTPVIESGESDFNTLGMQWRSHLTFGVAQQDPRGAAFSKGEA